MAKFRVHTKYVVISILFTCILVIGFFVVKISLNASFLHLQPKLAEAIKLNEQLGFVTDNSLSNLFQNGRPFNIVNLAAVPEDIALLQKANDFVKQIPIFEAEINSIQQEFISKVGEYTNAVKKYTQIDLAFLPSMESLMDLPLVNQKDPEQFISSLKSQFRESLIKYNTTAANPLRWEMNPAEEIKRMNNLQLAAQLFAFNLSGTTLSAADQEFISKYTPGTLTLFGENVREANQVKELIRQVEVLSPTLLIHIAVDQEGGSVKRIGWDSAPGGRSMGALGAEAQCAAWRARDTLLAGLGITWNLGIIADITSNSRSFIFNRTLSSDSTQAATNVKTAVDCTELTLETLKHFPGHGETTLDTHFQIARMISPTEVVWKTGTAIPFQTGIQAGPGSVMVGHLIVPWLDDSNPATISPAVLKYLRENLNYPGLIVTDDMNMLVAAGQKLNDVVKKSLLAGADVLFITINDARRGQLIEQTAQMIDRGELNRQDIEQRVARILTSKNKVAQDEIDSQLIY